MQVESLNGQNNNNKMKPKSNARASSKDARAKRIRIQNRLTCHRVPQEDEVEPDVP